MRHPRENNVWSRHQRLFEENVRKPKKRSTNLKDKRFQSCLRVGKVLAPHASTSRDDNLNLELCEIAYLNFYFFFIFEVDKSGALAPTYPPSKRKSDLRFSF